MSFLNPIMLAGMAAVAVPIIIHLLNRRRFQKVVWAAMRFLQTAVEQNQRRLQIEDMILLALRCALLVLLALALARPALLGEARDLLGQSKVTAVIVLDHSRSMGVTDGTSTRFDKAKKSAEQIVDSLPSGSSVAVLVASDTVRGAIAEPTYDLNLARKVIRDSTLTDRASDLFPAWQKAVETLHGRLTLRREIYLITDAQAVAWRQLPEIQRLLEQNKSEIRSHIILINEHEEKNLAITDLRLASGLCAARQTMRFEVKVTNYGREEARNIPIRLSIDGEAPADEINVESLPPGVTKNVTLFAKFRMEGFHGVTAQIPEDRLTADDRRTIVVRALAEAKVLLVDGDPGKEARESEVFFLRHALTPVAPDQAADYFVKSVTIPAAELSQARFDDFDTVILANVTDLNDTVIQALVSYLQRGGGLMVFPGNRLDPNFYNVKLFRERQILPAEFGTVVGAADQEEHFVGLQAKGFEHGITELWNDPGSGRLDTARFFRHFELKWASPGASPSGAAAAPSVPEAGPVRRVLSYADGTPAVVERSWGLGRVLQFSSSADTAWNDWPVRPAFVPFLHRALGSLVQRQDEGLNVRVGESFARRVGADFLDKEVTVLSPRTGESQRDLRPIDVVRGQPTVQYAATEWAGIYEVTCADPALRVQFAAQADAQESGLDSLSPAQRNTLQQVASIFDWSPDMSLRNLVKTRRQGIELWLPFLVAALLVAATETFLGQWFSRSH